MKNVDLSLNTMYCFCNQRDNASGWLNVVEILLNDHILKMPFRKKKLAVVV